MGTRASAGSKDRERRAGPAGVRAECVSPCDLAPGPDWGGGRGLRPAGAPESSPSGCERAGRGDAVGLAGGRVGREAAPREAVQGPQGDRSGFPAASPASTAGLASGGGGGQRAALRVSSDISSGWEGRVGMDFQASVSLLSLESCFPESLCGDSLVIGGYHHARMCFWGESFFSI